MSDRGRPAPERRALVCGISGQDGAYLARHLLGQGYQLWGTSRATPDRALAGLRSLGVVDQVDVRTVDLVDFDAVLNVVASVRPHEIYNLSGQSSVGRSFEAPIETMASIATATGHLLEAVRRVDPSIRYFNAGSGECFGDTKGAAITESTPFNPRSPYAVAKAAAAQLVTVYRESYGLFASTALLFNHESPLRPEGFVTMKVVAAAHRIAEGSDEKLRLGNIDIRRDWGWAPEYVDAMWRILQCERPDDFVIATGVSQSLRDFVETVFSEAGLDWRDHVISDPNLLRPFDPLEVNARPAKAESVLNWRASCVGADVARRLLAARRKISHI